ncbi:MAG: hypothetical protein LUC18_00065 [Porphyromonadaceae bacterium]|nr:hypothetical protein [Porphyromonadaceae bacterium]
MKIQEMIAKLQRLEARYGNEEMHFAALTGSGQNIDFYHLRLEDVYAAVPPDENGNDGGAAPCEFYWDFRRIDR